MTEQAWLTAVYPTPMLAFIEPTATIRKLRLFGAACCRRGWERLPSGLLREMVGAVEMVADGKADPSILAQLRRETLGADVFFKYVRILGLQKPSVRTTVEVLGGACRLMALQGNAIHQSLWNVEYVYQVGLVRDVFGNPFCPSPPLPPAVLAWNGGTVRHIAEAVYDERRMPEGTLDVARLAILADALEDAGCGNPDILAHCRGAGAHVRGCWAVDLVLGSG